MEYGASTKAIDAPNHLTEEECSRTRWRPPGTVDPMAAATYSLKLPNHYIVIDLNGQRTLLDTGSLFTFSPAGGVRLLQREFQVARDFGFFFERTRGLKALFDAVLGSDLLRHHSFTIHWDEREIVFSEVPLSRDGVHVPFELTSGLPLAHLEFDGTRRPVLLDTGAPLAYCRPELLAGLQSVAQAHDENPIMGEWHTPVYLLRWTIGDYEFPVPAGILPDHPLAHEGLRLAEAVIGTAIFRAFDPVCFNYPGREMILQPRPTLASACACEPADPPLFSAFRCPWLLDLG